MRIDVVASSTHIKVSHDAVCPEISPVDCARLGDLPFHTHNQGMTMTRLNTLVAYGLGRGWQVRGEMPLDHKYMTIEYKDADGNPYEPVYAGIHHRDETLVGLGDARWTVSNFAQVSDTWVVGGGLGTTIPLGRIEEDPYRLAEQSKKHQHVQMGSGTFDPMGSLSAIWMGHQWGFFSSLNGRLPLYANRNGYKPVSALQTSMGPSLRATGKLMFVLTTDLLHEGQAYWGDRADPLSGRTTLGTSVSVVYRFSTTIAAMAQGRVNVFQWSQTDQITQPVIGVLGVSITPKKKDKQ